ncbi:uncharacterized protein TRAVEDRAFT_44865 [Trametes versicolor FP-101664 SS1]|uniref:uncharacterized protein n=1 Tax=Trametes versicolor (strain FP-101664) TaxID=717944 RepID=UPI0004622883|nr:uncharacterized protein TRAVEDRAFT_44865 [Trametes versicolor FP-101664 SS1]EIW62029.1 hypothetical protein TRAVEDRAFT_44865 [Trametes versicolor FP-101664 SS1]
MSPPPRADSQAVDPRPPSRTGPETEGAPQGVDADGKGKSVEGRGPSSDSGGLPQPGSGSNGAIAGGQWPPGSYPTGPYPAQGFHGLPHPGGLDGQAYMNMIASFMNNPALMAAQGFGPIPQQGWYGVEARGMMPGGPGIGQYMPPGRPDGRDGHGTVNADRQLQASTQESLGHGREANIDPDLRTAQSRIAPSEATVTPNGDDVVTMTRADIKALVIEETQKSVMETLAGLQENRTDAAESVPVEVRTAVHKDLRLLIGVNKKARRGRGRKRAYILPDPLPVGVAKRKAPDLTTLFNPEWEDDVDVGVNDELVEATVSLVKTNAAQHKLSPAQVDGELIKRATVVYFNTLKRQYLADHDADAGEKRQKKMDKDMHRSRRHRKADTLRVGIPAFRRAFGEPETAGIDELVATPWQSEEHSSDGDADPEERQKCREDWGVGPKALEVRPLTWRSRKLTMLYIVLAVFARFVRNCEDVDDAVVTAAGPEEAGSDSEAAAEALRAEYLARVIAASKDCHTVYANSWQFLERFRGPKANARTKPHRDSKHKIYKECISDTWASKSTDRSRILNNAPLCPPTVNIFGLEIPEVLIPEADLKWLNEMDDSSSDESSVSGEEE